MTLTTFWHRRICEAVILVAVIILALYVWAYVADVPEIGAGLLVSDEAALFSGISLFVAFVSYLWVPKKYTRWGSLGAFLLLSATIATLIISTGGVSSPFVALWMLASVFAGVFGYYGLFPLLLATLAYLIFHYVDGDLTREMITNVVLVGELPLAVSYLIWHDKSATDTKNGKDRAYHDLATELSHVSGKSEVVINAIADGVIALNGQGVIQLINPAAQRIIGWDKQDALSLDYKSVLKLLDKNDRELTPANDPVSQTIATNKEVSSSDLSLVTHSGKKILTSIIVSPVGQPGEGVIVVFRDVTLEKREGRQQAEFISTAAHEMRTPVASIEGYLGLALNPSTAQVDEKAREFINKAHESAQHLGNLFQDLLDVSKADDGRLTNNPKVVDVVAFTHDIFAGLRPKAEQKGLHYLFKPQPDDSEEAGERRLNPVYYANVDNDHLREVISNLIDNAIKYTPKGDVVVDIGGDSDNVQISVADSGIGIPKEDQSHLFQKFYRVDNSDTREIGGTGLGLYLCRRLVEAMNGRIWVDSEYKKGSTFYVEVPRIDHEEATRLIEAASIQQEQAPQTTSITAVESEPQLPPQLPQQEPTPAVAPLPQPAEYQQPQPSPIVTQVAPQEQQPSVLGGGESVYTTAPVKTVVQQMQQAQMSQQPQQGYPQPTPAAPQYQQQEAAPLYQSRPVLTRENIPLTSIEQNPNQYLRRRADGVPVPPRDQNKP